MDDFQAQKPDPREAAPIRPLESDADVSIHPLSLNNRQECAALIYHLIGHFPSISWIFVFSLQALLTRLCGCDKLLQSLSIELSQLQMDKVSNIQPTDINTLRCLVLAW